MNATSVQGSNGKASGWTTFPQGGLTRLPALALLIAGMSSLTPHAAANSGTNQVVQGNTAFAIDLYQRERTSAGNLFFSPFSISSALAMTYAGAAGETKTEMGRVLHFESNDVHAGFRQLNDRLKEIERGGKVSLDIANSLWCEQKYPFLESFLKRNREFYQAEVRAVDFMSSAEQVRQQINSWIAKSTHDKIQDLIQPGQLSPQTTLVLCNAIYFKGKWTSQFDSKVTGPMAFHAKSGDVDVMMMSRTMNVRSHQVDDATLFALPYADGSLSMFILLPDAVDGLDVVEKNLTAARLQQWLTLLDGARETEARVFLPRFKLDCRLELATTLAKMGMPKAFTSQADFSAISAQGNLFISAVTHQAFVEVNEEGTEAAAATAITMRRTSFTPQMLQLRVDHPFLFLIRENQTGDILFLGRVLSPK